LAKVLKGLNKPAPRELDPEDFDIQDAPTKTKIKTTELEQDQPSPAIRKPEGRILRGLDGFDRTQKYSGKRISRKDIENMIESDEEQESEQEESENEQEESESENEQESDNQQQEQSESENEQQETNDDASSSEDEGARDENIVLRSKPKRAENESKHVKNQFNLWCELVGFRIRMQPLLQDTFKLPSETLLTNIADTRPSVKETVYECKASLKNVISQLVEIRDNISGDSQKRSLEDVDWDEVEQGNKKSREFYETTFDDWHRRVQAKRAGSAPGSRQLKAIGQSISEQINNMFLGDSASEVVSRSQMRPGDVKKIGDNSEKADEMIPDDQVYNDSAFYQQLLLNFVSTTNAANAVRVAEADNDLVQDRLRRKLQRRKKKRKVDTKASKGRKLRFTVHEKLVNFIAPRTAMEAPVDTDQLFQSLFA